MITIEQEKCTACGICVDICHEYCMHIENDILAIDHTYCSNCTQCIAVCPQQALSWDNTEPELFNKENFPTSLELEELLRERRTIRFFKDKTVGRNLLEEVVGYAVYAPTHDFNLRAIIVNDRKLIELADKRIFRVTSSIYKWLYRPKFIFRFVKWFAPGNVHEYLKAKPKLEASMARGRNFKSVIPALVFIVARKGNPLTLESAQYALYNIDLYARTRGLGCRNLVGNQMFLNNRNFRKNIGLRKDERIYATMALGYPAIKFRNKVNGKKMSIQWNTGNDQGSADLS